MPDIALISLCSLCKSHAADCSTIYNIVLERSHQFNPIRLASDASYIDNPVGCTYVYNDINLQYAAADGPSILIPSNIYDDDMMC
jgi:hypothetical protein